MEGHSFLAGSLLISYIEHMCSCYSEISLVHTFRSCVFFSICFLCLSFLPLGRKRLPMTTEVIYLSHLYYLLEHSFFFSSTMRWNVTKIYSCISQMSSSLLSTKSCGSLVKDLCQRPEKS